MFGDDEITPSDPMPAPPVHRPSDLSVTVIQDALRDCDYELAAAARRLGISRPALYDLVRKRMPDYRFAEDLTADQIREALDSASGDPIEAARLLQISSRALRRRMKRLGL